LRAFMKFMLAFWMVLQKYAVNAVVDKCIRLFFAFCLRALTSYVLPCLFVFQI
jgi:hypothetical protein